MFAFIRACKAASLGILPTNAELAGNQYHGRCIMFFEASFHRATALYLPRDFTEYHSADFKPYRYNRHRGNFRKAEKARYELPWIMSVS